jgi:hypothetical protein
MTAESRVEKATGGGTVAALRGLAMASGHDVEYLARLARDNKLGEVLFRGGPTYSYSEPDPESACDVAALAARNRPASPRHAQLWLMGKRFGPS